MPSITSCTDTIKFLRRAYSAIPPARVLTFLMIIALFLFSSCCGGDERGGKMVIFHAGSLSVPFSRIAELFERENPGVDILLEAAGSRTCARKISELGRQCDVMASADYAVIDALLIPEHAGWNIKFAANEMVIAYTADSKRAEEIDPDNWYGILLDPDVAYGRSDPDSDPCGYRAVLTMKLAEVHYGVEDLAENMAGKDNRYIRPKETDLLGLLEAGSIDYIFIYRSVAQQHGLECLLLPDQVNLKNPEFASLYSSVSVRISGEKPGEYIERRGAPMVYGVTIPENAPNPTKALNFVHFLLSAEKGLKIMEENGQPPVVPMSAESYESIPEDLKKFALPAEKQQTETRRSAGAC